MARWFWLSISHEIVLGWQLQSSEAVTGLDYSFPRWLIHKAHTFVLKMTGLSSSPHAPFHRAVWGSLQHTNWLLPDQVIQERESKEEATVSFVIWLQKSHSVIFVVSYYLHRSTLFDVGEDYTGLKTTRWGSLGIAHWLPTTFGQHSWNSFAESKAIASEWSSHLYLIYSRFECKSHRTAWWVLVKCNSDDIILILLLCPWFFKELKSFLLLRWSHNLLSKR